MKLIYHITTQAGWDEARAAGRVVANSLVTEGFIHCSRQAQLLAVANRFFAGAQALLVLAIDEAAVAPWLKNEGPAEADDPFAENVPFAANVFPHVYGPIPIAA